MCFITFFLFFFFPLFPSFFHEVLLQILPCFSLWTKIVSPPPGGGNGQYIYPCLSAQDSVFWTGWFGSIRISNDFWLGIHSFAFWLFILLFVKNSVEQIYANCCWLRFLYLTINHLIPMVFNFHHLLFTFIFTRVNMRLKSVKFFLVELIVENADPTERFEYLKKLIIFIRAAK